MHTKFKAYSLIEIVLAIGIFSLIISSVGIFAVDAVRVLRNSRQKTAAALYLQEVGNAIYVNKQDVWSSIAMADSGTKHLVLENNRYEFADGTITVSEGIEIGLSIDQVYRDGSGNIVPQAQGTADFHSRKITLQADWEDFLGKVHQYKTEIYVNDWNTLQKIQTTVSDFTQGTLVNTVVQNKNGGEVILSSTAYNDWCRPELTDTSYNLPGSGVATILGSVPGKAYLGNTSGASLQNLVVNHNVLPATVTVNGTFSGYQTKSIFGEQNYAYLATTNDSKEVVIVDVSNNPPVETGYFDASGNVDGQSVYVVGNVGYMAQGRYIRAFDLSGKNGARSEISNLLLAGTLGYVSDINIRGNYLFAALYNDWYEFAIVDISNPANMVITSQTSVNYQQTTDIYVSDDGNRVYFGTGSSVAKEVFIMDTTSKTGSRPVIGSYETNGMNVKGITVTDSKVIVVGTSGEEYQVINIANPTSPVRCGGLQINTGLNGITTVVTSGGDNYAYIIGNDSNNEFRIVKGGPGGSGGGSGGYAVNGEFTSSIIDTEVDDPDYMTIDWTRDIPSGTLFQLQVRASDNSNMSGATAWMGPDGTGSTYFTNNAGEYTPTVLDGLRYFQYKLNFGSNNLYTPTFSDIRINYE